MSLTCHVSHTQFPIPVVLWSQCKHLHRYIFCSLVMNARWIENFSIFAKPICGEANQRNVNNIISSFFVSFAKRFTWMELISVGFLVCNKNFKMKINTKKAIFVNMKTAKTCNPNKFKFELCESKDQKRLNKEMKKKQRNKTTATTMTTFEKQRNALIINKIGN